MECENKFTDQKSFKEKLNELKKDYSRKMSIEKINGDTVEMNSEANTKFSNETH